MSRIRAAKLIPWIFATAFAVTPPFAVAAAACSEGPAGGIGGTSELARGGIGGTSGPAQGGIGGTSDVARGGIGGTGAPTELALGGIGGTGQVALPIAAGETGAVIGTITGFASICVNGLEVHYEDSTPVTDNGAPGSTRSLAIGQVVAIEASPSQRGLEAKQVAIVHAVVGPVSRVDGDQFEVMGQRVRKATGGDSPKPGQTVRVSGLRDADGVVVATRIVPTESQEVEHSVVGRVRGGRIEGLEIEAPDLPEDAEVIIRGRFEGGRLRARHVERDPARTFVERARAVSIEARISERSGGRIRAGGQRIELGDDTRVLGGRREDAERNRLIRASGRVDKDGNLRAERIEIRERREDRAGRDSASSDGRGTDDRREPRNGDDRGGHSANSGRDRTDRVERSNSGSDDRPDRTERVERTERAERVERVERPEHD